MNLETIERLNRCLECGGSVEGTGAYPVWAAPDQLLGFVHDEHDSADVAAWEGDR